MIAPEDLMARGLEARARQSRDPHLSQVRVDAFRCRCGLESSIDPHLWLTIGDSFRTTCVHCGLVTNLAFELGAD